MRADARGDERDKDASRITFENERIHGQERERDSRDRSRGTWERDVRDRDYASRDIRQQNASYSEDESRDPSRIRAAASSQPGDEASSKRRRHGEDEVLSIYHSLLNAETQQSSDRALKRSSGRHKERDREERSSRHRSEKERDRHDSSDRRRERKERDSRDEAGERDRDTRLADAPEKVCFVSSCRTCS